MEPLAPARLASLRKRLATWYRTSRRDLPWRRTTDPYRIWISEIMLQQTRVAAVIPYYHRFLERFPSAAALAGATDDELLSAWAGLGYYSRARNLREAARRITAASAFPATYQEILALPGIGPYTAAAIASIAFGLPYAVLDGNVIRVLARLTAETGEVTSTATRARLQDAAQRFLSPRTPADHNQAVMELGATICLPRDPKCSSCPLSADCGARKSGMERELPVKGRKAGIRRVGRKLLVAIEDGRILLWQRHRDAARLGGFWELPEPESPPEAPAGEPLYRFQHAITNHIYEFHVYAAPHSQPRPPWVWVPLADLPAIPLSTVARKALRGAGHSV